MPVLLAYSGKAYLKHSQHLVKFGASHVFKNFRCKDLCEIGWKQVKQILPSLATTTKLYAMIDITMYRTISIGDWSLLIFQGRERKNLEFFFFNPIFRRYRRRCTMRKICNGWTLCLTGGAWIKISLFSESVISLLLNSRDARPKKF